MEGDLTGIYKKLVAVYEDVKYIQKDKKNAFHNYTYASEAAIKDHLHEAFRKHGLVMLPPEMISVEDVERTDDKGKKKIITTAQIRFGIADQDSGEAVSGTVFSRGEDASDKGIYKAITGGLKYFLTTTFLIPTGDDPEEEPKGSKEAQQEVLKEKLKGKKPTPMSDEWKQQMTESLKHMSKALGQQEYFRIMGLAGYSSGAELCAAGRAVADDVYRQLADALKEKKGAELGVSADDLQPVA